jgi:hypothetical protein
MDLIHSNSSLASRFPSYMGTSILALPPNLATSLNKHYFAASFATASSTSTSSLYASLTSPTSGALFCVSSNVSNWARSSSISLSTTWLAKGDSHHLGGIMLTICHTQSTNLSSLSPFPPSPKVYRWKTNALIPPDADPLSLRRVARPLG